MCKKKVRAERTRSWLQKNFIYRCGRRGKEVVKVSDGNFIWKRRGREKNKDEGVRILSRDNFSDFRQIEIIGPDGVRTGGERVGTLRELSNEGLGIH